MFSNSAFNDIGADPGDYYPEDLWDEIDQINQASSTKG